MPGGVARVVEPDDMYRSRLLHGGVAKDVWVLTDEMQDIRGPALPVAQARGGRGAAVLQSRIADDLFWLGRYVERLDAGARLIRAVLNRLTGGGLGPRDMAELAHLATALHRNGWINAAIAGSSVDGAHFAEGIAKAATEDGGGVQDCLDAVRRLAFAVRDRLSLDMWHTLNHLLDEVRRSLVAGARDMDHLLDALDDLVRLIAAFAGLASENMTRGAGWRFLDIGRRIEQDDAITHTLAPVLKGPAAQLEVGLRLLALAWNCATRPSPTAPAIRPNSTLPAPSTWSWPTAAIRAPCSSSWSGCASSWRHCRRPAASRERQVW